MTPEKRHTHARFLYLCLAGIFISLIVSSNLIFLKFFEWSPVSTFTFVLSVGLIPYPLTFLVTDLISEFYGKDRASDVVKVGLICALLIMGLTILADIIPAREGSPVDDSTFHSVFGLTAAAVSASMIAYLLAQLIDIRIFHFWKVKTKGKKLWLRNNLSTIPSQLIDSFIVITLLCAWGGIPWEQYWITVTSLFIFKILIALADTPFFYLFTYLIKKHFGLKEMEELEV
ncbi:MAG: putative integral membrane protein (TIGR00697 family) [Arenicella sp.]|jgi:uncharacterized integral membrane protein (TIGR00697 family)